MVLLYNENMKNEKNKKEYKNFLIPAADSGTIFTIGILASLLLSLIIGIIFIVTGKNADEEFLKSNVYAFINFIISPVALGSVIVYSIKKNDLSLKYSAGFVRFNKKFWVIVVLLFLGSVAGLSSVNTLFVNALNKLIGYKTVATVIPQGNFGYFLLDVIIICALPALFEEVLFRGLIFNGIKRIGDVFAVLTSAILFSLFHHNPAQTIYQFILGTVFALLALKSGSIFPSIVFHFANNFIVILLYFLFGEELDFSAVVSIIITIAGIASFVIGFVMLLKSKKPEREEELCEKYLKIADKKEERKMFLLSSSIGIIACVALWISVLISGITGA